ncbi:MAG TPA: cytochrome c biogenesis protein CcsA [Vicinamibacterales bacterium]|nr:cytochrome c biogenesis protein CcsA [Vicinamibacterales bacterium]
MRLATRLLPLLLLVTAVFFIRAPFLIQAAPIESTMGVVQKIFYFHVPAAAATFLAATVCGIASLLFLWRRKPLADHVAVSAAELVVTFGIIVLITGPLWARKAWGIWWEWRDVRLTTTFVMWTTFAAYVLLRRFGGPGSNIMAAAFGLFGMVLVPIVYQSVSYWNTLHPKPTVVRTLPPEMAWPLWWGIAAFVLLFTALMIVRVRLEASRAALEEAYVELED